MAAVEDKARWRETHVGGGLLFTGPAVYSLDDSFVLFLSFIVPFLTFTMTFF